MDDNGILTAPEGMWLTDGMTWAKEVWLGKADAAERWRIADNDEYEAWLASQPPIEL